VPLTATPGFDSWPDISPDGNSIVYGWGPSPDSYTHLYVRNLESDAPLKLVESEASVRIGHARWAPDGQRIFYKLTSSRGGRDSIWSVARDGSDSREIVKLRSAELSSAIDVSPDGSSLIFADVRRQIWQFSVFSFGLQSGQKIELTDPQQGWGDWDPRLSPDGKQIAFKRVQRPGDDQIYLMPAAGGPTRSLKLLTQSIHGYSWTPEGSLLLAAQIGSSIHRLWLASPAGDSQPSLLFESGFDAIMPTANRDRVVWVNRVNDYNIYTVPLAGGTPVKRIASPLIDSMPALSSDGRLAFVSRRSGSSEIWISRPDGSGAVRVTNFKGELTPPRWSPDGATLAFSISRRDASKVYLMKCAPGTLACEPPETFADGVNPTWAANGKSLYVWDPGADRIRRVPLSGEAPVRVIDGSEALASKDGKWLYFPRRRERASFARIPLDADGNPSGPAETVLSYRPNSASMEHWTLAGDEIVFWESNVESKYSGLRAFNVVTGRLRSIIETPTAHYPAVSPDGKTVWYAQSDSAGASLMTAEWRR
jgi:Tol biopolymer transport system component